MDELLDEIIEEDQEIPSNNNNNQETLCTDEDDKYVLETDRSLNEPDFIGLIDEFDDFLPAEAEKTGSNNCNDRKCSISEDFGAMDLNCNNQDIPEDRFEAKLSSEPQNICKRKARTSKTEIMKMSETQKKENKRFGQRIATNRSYAKKKTKVLQITENLMKLRDNVKEKKQEMLKIEINLHNSIVMILERSGNENLEISRDLKDYKLEYEKCLRGIESDENVIELERDLKNAERRYLEALGDLEQKIKNQNTYGSKKCRAKTKKEEAENSLNLKKLELEFEAICKYLENLEIVKNRVFHYFLEFRNSMNLNEMYNLDPEIRDVFEELLTFYNLANPV